MADIWLGRFSRWLERLFNAKGGPLLFGVDPSIQAVVVLPTGPEDLAAQGVYRYAAFTAVAAVAAQQSVIQFTNPAGSNVIAVIELLGVVPSVATTSTFHLSQAPGGGSLTTRGFRLDARANPNSTCALSTANTPTGDLANVLITGSGNNAAGIVNLTLSSPLTVLPGDIIRVVDQTLNEAFTCNFLWRERPLESSELT